MSAFSLTEILRPELAEISAYSTHPGQFAIRLDANEAPPFLPARARAKLTEAVSELAWERYPDVTSDALRRALAERSGVSPEEILVGVGSDELIALLQTAASRARKASDPATILTTTPTFVMYRLGARARGLRVMEVPLDQHWDLGSDGLKSALNMATPNVVFIATPNNPTANLVSLDRLESLIESASSSLVIIDEAYIDYAPYNHLELFRKYPNVAILRTLSKIGFAALRVGWLIGRADLITEVNKVRSPYNISAVTQRLARVVLEDLWPAVKVGINTVLEERERLKDGIAQLKGFVAQPSHANFLWVRTERPARECFSELGKRGILVRSFHERGGRLAQHLRITVGTHAENDALLQALRDIDAQ